MEKGSYSDCFFGDLIKKDKVYSEHLMITHQRQSDQNFENYSAFLYKVYSNSVVIEDIDCAATDRISIPEYISERPVTKVQIKVRYNEKKLTVLYLPKNVEDIFLDADVSIKSIEISPENTNLWTDGVAIYTGDKKQLVVVSNREVTDYKILNSVCDIRGDAFCGCEKLRFIQLPTCLVSLGKGSLAGISKDTEVVGGDNICKIEQGAFESLGDRISNRFKTCLKNDILGKVLIHGDLTQKEFTVPDGITSIAEDAMNALFKSDNVEEIKLPETVKFLGKSCFHYLATLKTINLPNGIETIPEDCFCGCRNLATIDLPETIHYIKSSAFRDCGSLKIIMLPPGLKEIGPFAFSGTEIQDIKLPDAMEKLEPDSFHIDSLKEIHVSVNNQYFSERNGVLFTKDFRTLIRVPINYNCSHYDVPDGTVEIRERALSGCKIISSLTLPESVVKVGDDAFFGMTSLENIKIPGHIELMGDNVFEHTKIHKISLPKSIRHVGKEIFGPFGGGQCYEIEMYDNSVIDIFDSIGRIGLKLLITMRSAANNNILYKLYLPLSDVTLPVSNSLASVWNNDGKPDFKTLDQLFPKIEGTCNKAYIAMLRIEYPIELTRDVELKYRDYLNRVGHIVVSELMKYQDVEMISAVSKFGLIKKSNIEKLVNESAKLNMPEITAYLLNFKNEHL